MTNPQDKPHANEDGPPPGTGPSVRPWGTAHLTLTALFAAALVWCVLRPPGNTYDVHPLPVPAIGWVFWFSGLAFLASSATLHFRLGRAMRKCGVPGLSELATWALADAMVTVVTGRSFTLAAASHTYPFGLESLNATLFTAAGLSVVLLALTTLRRQASANGQGRVSVAGAVALVVHWIAAIVTVGGLLYLEYVSLPT